MSDDFAVWQDEATGPTVDVQVCLDGRLETDLAAAAAELAGLRKQHEGMLNTPDEVEQLAERVRELHGRWQEQARTLVFRVVPYTEWEALADEHPPTDAQREKFYDYNPDTFEPAAVAMACVEPGLTVEQATWLRDFLPRKRWHDVFDAARQVNVEGALPKSVSGIVGRFASELSSISAPPPASPSPSSADES